MVDALGNEDSLAGLRYRPSVQELEKDQNKLERFLKAWRGILAKPIGDETSFQHIAGIHGKPDPHFCNHRIHFFPWHRAYLLKLERALNKIDPEVALPWFDFTSSEAQRDGLPKSFRSIAEGGVDILASAPIEVDGGRQTIRSLRPPSELPTQTVLDSIQGQSNYVSYWRQYYPNVHNALHNWIGGDASTEDYTAFDPSFWIIHCANDRHWWLWQLNHPGANPPQLNRVLSGLDTIVGDVLDINALGYEYATTEITIEFEV